MPYKLRKAPKKDAYWVVNKQTGKKYSHEPLPHKTAIKQLRALYAQENGYKQNLKGGELNNPELLLEYQRAIKQVMDNMRQKNEQLIQKEKAALDGNMTGGLFYPGTDEVPIPLDENRYKKSFWEKVGEFFEMIGKAILKGLQAIGNFFGKMFTTIINTVSALGNILGDVFTGKFEHLASSGSAFLVALDEMADAVPGLGVFKSITNVISSVVQGKAPNLGDILEIGTAIAGALTLGAGSVASSVAKTVVKNIAKDIAMSAVMAGVAGAITPDEVAEKEMIDDGTIRDDIEQTMKNDIAARIQARLGDGSEEYANQEAAKILFKQWLKEHPEVPQYIFRSQIRNKEEIVVFASKAVFDEANLTVPHGQNIDTELEQLRRQIGYGQLGFDKNLGDDILKLWFFRQPNYMFYASEYNANILGAVARAKDGTPVSTNPLENNPFYGLNKHDQIVLEQIALDNAFVADKPYIENVLADLKTKLSGKSYIIAFRKSGKDLRTFFGEFRDKLIPTLQDYDKLTPNGKERIKDVVENAMRNYYVQITRQDEYNKDLIEAVDEQLKDKAGDFIPEALDGLISILAEQNKTISREQYDALLQSATIERQNISNTFVRDALTKLIKDNFKTKGTLLDNEQLTQFISDMTQRLQEKINDSLTSFFLKKPMSDFNALKEAKGHVNNQESKIWGMYGSMDADRASPESLAELERLRNIVKSMEFEILTNPSNFKSTNTKTLEIENGTAVIDKKYEILKRKVRIDDEQALLMAKIAAENEYSRDRTNEEAKQKYIKLSREHYAYIQEGIWRIFQELDAQRLQEIEELKKNVNANVPVKFQTEDELRIELGLKPKPRPVSTPVLQPPPALEKTKGKAKIKPTLSKAEPPPPPMIAPNVANAEKVPIHEEEENPTNVEEPPVIQQQKDAEDKERQAQEDAADEAPKEVAPKRRSTRPETKITQDEVIGTEVATGILKTQIPAIVKELRKFNQRAMATMAAAPRRRFGRGNF